MKKTILAVTFLVSALTLSAYEGDFSRPLMEEQLERTVATAQASALLPWQKELKQIEDQWRRLGSNASAYDPLPVMVHTPLSHKEEPVYLRRFMQVQQSISANKVLAGYKFIAPVPVDLARFSLDNYAALHAFLKDLKLAEVTRMKRIRPFTLSVQIKGVPQGELELWVDVPGKKVYLMSNNLYTTAEGKYGLHLK